MIKIISEDVRMPSMNQRRYQMEPLNNNLWQILDKETGSKKKPFGEDQPLPDGFFPPTGTRNIGRVF